jgi:hypothetical protein
MKCGEFPDPAPGKAPVGITIHDVSLIPTGNSLNEPHVFLGRRNPDFVVLITFPTVKIPPKGVSNG